MEQIESDTSAIATASYGTIIYSCIEILYSQKNYHIRICSDATTTVFSFGSNSQFSMWVLLGVEGAVATSIRNGIL